MPIRHLDIHLDERQLVQSSPIQNLRGWRIGIEANQWLKRLLRSAKGATGVKEVIETSLIQSMAIGGTIPDALLESLVLSELDQFRNYEIKPVFVFSGLPTLRHERPFSVEDSRPAKRNSAWNAYTEGRESQAHALWQASSSILHAEYVPFIIDLLDKHGAEYIRAPYAAWAQLAYMESHPRRFIHGILCGSEILLWPVGQIILNFDWDMQLFYWVNRTAVLQSMNLVSHDQFIDTCLLAGFDWIPTFPGLVDSSAERRNIFSFKSAIDLVRAHQSGIGAIAASKVTDSTLMKTFFRVKCSVRYHPVMSLEGLVRPYFMDNGCPTDLQSLFGPKLSELAYFWVSLGVIAPQVFSTITLGLLPEFAPLDSTQTPEYRMFLTGRLVQGLRSEALSSVTALFLSNGETTSIPAVHTVYWFDPKANVLIPNDPSRGFAAQARELYWLGSDLFYGLRKKKGVPTFANVMASLAKACQRVKDGAIAPTAPDPPLVPNTAGEILAASLAAFLYMRKFTADKATKLTAYGSALNRYLLKGKTGSLFCEEMVLLLELLKEPQMLSENYQDCHDALPAEVRLISRIAALLPVTLNSGVVWNGPYNRPLLVFYSFVRPVYRGLRILLETAVLSVLLLEHDTPSKTQILLNANEHLCRDLSTAMPFSHDRSVALGIAMQLLLLSGSDANAKRKLAEIKKNCVNLERDLANAALFFRDVVEVVSSLELPELAYTKAQFEAANEYLNNSVKFPIQI